MGLSPFMFMVKGAVDEGTRLMNEVRAGRAEIAKDKRAQADQLARLGFQRQTKLLQVDAESAMRSKLLGEELAGKAAEGLLDRNSREKIAEWNNAATLGKNKALLRQNNEIFGDPDGIHILAPRTGGTAPERSRTFFSRLAMLAENNPEAYKNLRDTTGLLPYMQQQLNGLAGSDTVTNVEGKITQQGHPMKKSLAGVFKPNTLLYKDMLNLSNNILRDGFRGSANVTETGDNVNSELVTSFTNSAEEDAALKNFNKTLISADAVNNLNTPQGKAVARTRLADQYGIRPVEGRGLMFYQAMANTGLMNVLAGKGQDADRKQAVAFLNKDRERWFDSDGRITQNMKLLVAIGAGKKAVQMKGQAYARASAIPYVTLDEQDLQKVASYKNYTDATPLAKAALKTTNKLMDTLRATQTPSNLIADVRGIVSVIPDLVQQVKIALVSAGPMGNDLREALSGHLETATKLGSKSGVLTDSDKTALTKSLRYILAYQLSSVLQGGTGGKTISDQDVKINTRIIGDDFFTNMPRSMAKLEIIKELMVNTINMGELYSIPLTGQGEWHNNKDMLRTISAVGSLLEMDALKGTYEQRESRLKNKIATKLSQRDLNRSGFASQESLVQAIKTVNKDTFPQFKDFDQAKFSEWRKNNLVGPVGSVGAVKVADQKQITNFRILKEDEGTNYIIVDDDSMIKARNARGITKEKAQNIISQLSKTGYDVQSNTSVPITYKIVEDDTDTGKVNILMFYELESEPVISEAAKRDETFQVKVDGYLGGLTKQDGLNQRQFSTAAVRELKGLGVNFSPEGFIALMQNFRQELGSDMMGEMFNGITTKQLGGGKTETNAGIAQWRGDRLKAFEKFARGRKDGDIRTLKTNLEFLIYEMQNGEAGGENKREYRKLFRELTENPNRRSAEELGALINGVYLRSQRPNKLDYKGGSRTIPGRKPFFNSTRLKNKRGG